MTEPIADVKESAGRGKLIACGDVAVREDEVLDIGGLHHLAGEPHLGFFLPFEDERVLIVGVTAHAGTESCDGERLSRMQHAVEPPVEPAVQDSFDQQVFALLAT